MQLSFSEKLCSIAENDNFNSACVHRNNRPVGTFAYTAEVVCDLSFGLHIPHGKHADYEIGYIAAFPKYAFEHDGNHIHLDDGVDGPNHDDDHPSQC
jgi:hypothetical protein